MHAEIKNQIQKWSDKAIELAEETTLSSLTQSAYSRAELINILKNHDNEIRVKRSNLIQLL